MSERIERIKRNLADGRQRLNYVLDRVGDGWNTQVYAEGAAWTVQQLATHLMITDKGQNNTIMGIAKGEDPIPADFDLERYNRRSVEKRADVTVPEIRAALATSEAERNTWLDTLSDTDLDKKGRHGSMRILSVEEITDVMADHERAHANDIAKVLNIA